MWMTFNRTIVELKYDWFSSVRAVAFSFNRTIVELKFTCPERSMVSGSTFNRTIVELKFTSICNPFGLQHLLIVP